MNEKQLSERVGAAFGRKHQSSGKDSDIVSESVHKAFHGETAPTVAEGALPLKKRELGATRVWVAKESAKTATDKLRTVIMEADPATPYYVAEREAQAIAQEAYAQVSTSKEYDDERWEAVSQWVDLAAKRIPDFKGAGRSTSTLRGR